MDSAELYGITDLNSEEVLPYNHPDVEHMKAVVMEGLEQNLNRRKVIQGMIITDVLSNKEELDAVLADVIRCTSELIDSALESMGYVNVNINYFLAFGLVCLVIALKIMGAHDWIYGDVDYYRILGAHSTTAVAAGITPKLLRLMEHDILERTNWKGCPSSFIHTPEESFFGLRHKSRHSGRKRSSKNRHSGMKRSSKSRHSGMKRSSKNRHSGMKRSSRYSREDFF